MSKTIAIVGAGPGVGQAVARRFGSRGFKVALLARKREKLDKLVERLKTENIEAAGFTADLRNRPTLEAALGQAIGHFGSIDVLEYSPAPEMPGTVMTATAMDVENELYQLDVGVLGAIAAVRTVLPKMLERKDGAILLTTAASALHPLAITASFGVAAGATLNYGRVLNQELAQHNVYAGVVMISGLVVERGEAGGRSPAGLELIASDDVADLHWDLYTRRNRVEAVIGDTDAVLKLVGRKFAVPVERLPLKDNPG
jgi:NADP-dependent 3-hydroxy acid dehydrogenase YdfG